MFKKKSPQYVADEGRQVSLEAVSPYGFLYKWGEKSVEIFSEPLVEGDAPYKVSVPIGDISRWDTPDSEIQAQELIVIIQHLQEAFDALGIEVEFDE